jgi:hypothetical protein
MPRVGEVVVPGDFRVVGARVADDSVELIFTDPPYADVRDYAGLGAFANRVLVPGGLCLAYAGKLYLPQALTKLGAHLEYLWTCAVLYSGGGAHFRARRVYEGWKPVLCFGKAPVQPWWDWFPDTVSGGREKDLHPWQQPEAEAIHFIGALSRPGGLVCDPFCGSGTTGAAALRLGRRFIGFEIDPGAIALARERLAGLGSKGVFQSGLGSHVPNSPLEG